MHFSASSTIPKSNPREQGMQDIFTSSTSSSGSSKFSIIHHSDTTALTSAATALEKNGGVFEDTGNFMSDLAYEIDNATLDLQGEQFAPQETSAVSSDRNSSPTVKPEQFSSPPRETVASSGGNSSATTKAEKATSPYVPPPPIAGAELPQAGKISSPSGYIITTSSTAPPVLSDGNRTRYPPCSEIIYSEARFLCNATCTIQPYTRSQINRINSQAGICTASAENSKGY